LEEAPKQTGIPDIAVADSHTFRRFAIGLLHKWLAKRQRMGNSTVSPRLLASVRINETEQETS
jgi:hypothetical protein